MKVINFMGQRKLAQLFSLSWCSSPLVPWRPAA